MILSTFLHSLQKLELVNGVLFTGGVANDGLYFEIVGRIFKVSIITVIEGRSTSIVKYTCIC